MHKATSYQILIRQLVDNYTFLEITLVRINRHNLNYFLNIQAKTFNKNKCSYIHKDRDSHVLVIWYYTLKQLAASCIIL